MRIPIITLFAGVALAILTCRSPSSTQEPKGAIIPPQGGDQVQIGTGSHPVLIKVDPARTGSQGLFAFQLTLGPGDSLPVHRHHRDDELFFVHTGGVTALVGDQRKPAAAGTTLFIPAGTPVGLENPGTATAVLLIVFAAPHMAEYIRSLGHAPGTAPPPLSDDELEEIRKRHHITFP